MIRIVAGTYEGLLYGWEMPTTGGNGPAKMKLTFGYSAHSECIKSVALMAAKQGKTLLSGSADEMIKIYNVSKRVEVGSLMEQHGAITSLEFFGQSHMLSGSADNSICIWRTADWNCLHILGGHKGEINSVAVHPSGKMCFSVARDKTLRMWNLVKGRIAFIRRLEKEASLVLISQKGSRYALGFGNEVSVFNINAELVGSLQHKQRIHCAVFAADEYVVCGGDDKYIYVWKTDGTLVAKVTHADITARIKSMQVVYAQGEDKLPWVVVATSNGTVQVWDLATFTLDPLAPEEVNASTAPVASTTLMSKPRVTCLSACLATEPEADASSSKADASSTKPKASRKKSKPSPSAASAPHVVVEMDGGDKEEEEEEKPAEVAASTHQKKRKAPQGKSQQLKKAKTPESKQEQPNTSQQQQKTKKKKGKKGGKKA